MLVVMSFFWLGKKAGVLSWPGARSARRDNRLLPNCPAPVGPGLPCCRISVMFGECCCMVLSCKEKKPHSYWHVIYFFFSKLFFLG